MKRLLSIIIVMLSVSTVIAITSSASSKPISTGTDPEFKKEWAKVDSLERKGLYRMALTEVGLIFDQAAKNQQHTQVIKAVLYELKYNSYLEEDDYVLGIYRLNELVEKAPSPSKEILHSLIAEVYWGYYYSNSWKFADRTNVVEMDIKDVRTWDLKRIAEKVRMHYFLSLQNRELSQSEDISNYDAIASYTYESNEIRPTLFDFLAHRALDFFKNNTFAVPGPAETFVMEDEKYFGSSSTFLGIQPQTNDSLNTQFFAVLVLQELTKFHTEKGNIAALFEVDLERIKFTYNKSVLSNKDALYYDALNRLTTAYEKLPYVSEAWYEIALVHSTRGDQYNYLADTTHRWDKKVAVEICTKTMARYKDTYGANLCAALKSGIEQKNLTLRGEEGIIPDTPSKVLLEYKNVNKVYMKVAPYDYKKYYNNRIDYDKFIKELRGIKGIYSKEIEITDPGDYQNHSTELLLPELGKGFYFVIISTDPSFADSKNAFAFMPMWVTNITYQNRTTKENNQIMVSDRASGKPMVGAKVNVTYEEYNYKLRFYEQKTLGNFTTDENGLVEYPLGEDYRTYMISVTHNGEVYAPNQGIYSYNYYSYYDYQQEVYTYFFTDRKLYRPGQPIYFKGICVSYSGKDRKVLADYTSSVALYDANGQEIKRQDFTTNKFGSFEGTFNAPYDVLTGNMTISNSSGSAYFRVEEYKRPKFEVTMNPVEGEVKVNEPVTVTGFAQAYAGNRLDGADVKYRITRTTGFSWSYYSYWYWWRPYYQPKEIQHGDMVTDDNGEFKITFNALPDKEVDPKNLPLFTYTVYVDVTDINGETHTTSTSFVVGYQSLQLGNNWSADMNNEDDHFIRLSATNLNGQKIPAQGKITVSKLQMPDRPFYNRLWQQPDMQTISEIEFKKLFPNEQFKNESDFYTWKEEKTVFETNFNTKETDSIVIANYKTWTPGVYKYSAVAKDKNGIEVKDEYYFTVYNPSSSTAPKNDVLWVKNVQNTAQPGETVDVLISSKEKDLSVFYDVEVQNKIVESKRITLNDEQKKLSFTVTEEHRGNFTIHFTAIKNNRKFSSSITVVVPYTNKELDLSFSTFRNKLLPGAEEEWTLTIKNRKGSAEQAELLATLYDASLDQLYTPNSFYMSIWQSYYGSMYWGEPEGMQSTMAYNINYYWNDYVNYPYRYFPTLNYHGFNAYYYGRYYYYGYYEDGDYSLDAVSIQTKEEGGGRRDNERSKDNKNMELSEAEAPMDAPAGGALFSTTGASGVTANEQTLSGEMQQMPVQGNDGKLMDLSNVSTRANFNETAFFYPQLTTDANGDVKIKFTIPESLTKWKFLGMAHTTDLKVGTIQEEVVTQKDLMVVPNAPRFFREGDKIVFSAKISNISKENLSGRVQLDLLNPFDESLLNEQFKHKEVQLPFSVEAGKSTVVSWSLEVPYAVSAVKYKIVAAANNFSDGEENVVPILSNRMLVTEAMPMPLRGNQSRTFKFEKLLNNKSKTLKHHRYTLEFTSNPAWYAIQAMPYMMEYPYECAEQTFTRYYSNAIASHIMNSNPKIKEVIEAWGENSPDAFLSNLQKNEELKSVILQETPWVLDAQNEEQSKRNLAVLLDMERMSRELDKALTKVIKAQSVNGGWPWFPGMPENRYITQHIITGMGHLDHLGIKDVKENHKVWQMVKKGVDYLDGEIVRDYVYIKKWDPNYLENQHLGYTQIQYLYARSYFPQLGMNKATEEAVGYFKDQAVKFWLNFNVYAKGMIALAAHRFEMKELSTDIVKSLKDNAIRHDEFGMYWKEYQIGWYWYEAPIETQALMIEMFDEVTDDQETVEELKIWLLKQKQTTNWKTTKQTTEAVYALLLKGSDLLADDSFVEITVGGRPIEYVTNADGTDPYKVEAQEGTGYIKTSWANDAIKENMGEITLKKNSKGIAWGAAYWQYFEDLDKITFAETPLSLQKQLFLVEVTNSGEVLKPINDKNVLHVGDKIRCRIELRTDRNLEYVHMKDMRASGFEPVNVLSMYKWQDGLGYYEATKDAATNFFFDYIPKGTYVFEYDMKVQHKGDFSNGITTIQCMYAPEFTSHSEGIRVVVE
ncbi:MAG: hypothetical protein IPH66_00075 [Crocinitomicaceae bacterium]|nr:hypothetical protein [Crocinitomicaceae bacterium]